MLKCEKDLDIWKYFINFASRKFNQLITIQL